jgi:hypothetical protein
MAQRAAARRSTGGTGDAAWRCIGVETHGSEPAQAVAARGVEVKRSGSDGEGQ